MIFVPRVRHGQLSLLAVEDSAGAAGKNDVCGGGRVYPKEADQPARPMAVPHRHWYSLAAVVGVDHGMGHRRMLEGVKGTIVDRRGL